MRLTRTYACIRQRGRSAQTHEAAFTSMHDDRRQVSRLTRDEYGSNVSNISNLYGSLGWQAPSGAANLLQEFVRWSATIFHQSMSINNT